MSETRIHPETGQLLRRDVRSQIVRVGSLSQVVDVPGWYPDGEGDAIHSGADLKDSDAVFQSLRARYAAHVRDVRKKLKLTQEEAGIIIGGGKRAFQKYESGANPPSDAAVGLIELLARHPEEVETLRGIRPIAAETIGRSYRTGLMRGGAAARGMAKPRKARA